MPIPDAFSQDPAILAMRVNALEEALQRMVQAQQQNHMELRKAFSMTDAHLWVLKRICEDFTAGSVKLADATAKGVEQINFHAYYDEFNEHMRAQMVAAEVASSKKLEEAKKKKQETQQAEVFGGDQDVASP